VLILKNKEIIHEIIKYSKYLYESNLVESSHSGNISVRVGNDFYIKKRGAMLQNLVPENIIRIPIYKDSSNIILASTETEVHKSIYMNTNALAIIHVHGTYSILVSLNNKEILPIDEEGKYFIHKIPVIAVKKSIGSQELAQNLSSTLKNYSVVIVQGHGLFASGTNLEDAYSYTTTAEHICKLVYLAQKPKHNVKKVKW